VKREGKGWTFIRRPTDAEVAAEARAVVRTRASFENPKMPVLKFRGQEHRLPSLVDSTVSVCAVKKTIQYTGTKMLGIAVMHKSNAVPVFSVEEAKDISKMRR